MEPLYVALADAVVVLHVSYVAFVILGELAILFGVLGRWQWIRNRTFRVLHLAAIGVVVFESWSGFVCPLTTLENWLREQAGQTVEQGDFIARWVHSVLFYRADPAVFTAIYSAFGGLVLLTLILAPPRLRRPRAESQTSNESGEQMSQTSR
jgi:drug/metabolite transporter superfamily protein YnfA